MSFNLYSYFSVLKIKLTYGYTDENIITIIFLTFYLLVLRKCCVSGALSLSALRPNNVLVAPCWSLMVLVILALFVLLGVLAAGQAYGP